MREYLATKVQHLYLMNGLFTRPVDLRFFYSLEEILGTYEIKEFERTDMQRPYQFGIALYHLAKLQMLDFSYDFYVKCLNRQNFELCYMDIDSFYLAMSGDSLDEMVKLGLRQAYELTRKMERQTNLAKAPGLFNPEFIGTRGVWPTAKCYLV